MLSNDIEILKIANKWKSAGKKVILATVIQTWGSAPRGVGSKLIIDQDGKFLPVIKDYAGVYVKDADSDIT